MDKAPATTVNDDLPVARHSPDCECLDCDVRDALRALLEACEVGMEECGNDEDEPETEAHECRLTRAYDQGTKVLARVLERTGADPDRLAPLPRPAADFVGRR